MLRRSAFVLSAILGASCLTANPAIASTQCFCDNGVVVQSMVDDGDDGDCDDACSEFGGGRLWTPADAASSGGGNDTVVGVPNADENVRPAEAGAIERRR
jgi:hypothetical protein